MTRKRKYSDTSTSARTTKPRLGGDKDSDRLQPTTLRTTGKDSQRSSDRSMGSRELSFGSVQPSQTNINPSSGPPNPEEVWIFEVDSYSTPFLLLVTYFVVFIFAPLERDKIGDIFTFFSTQDNTKLPSFNRWHLESRKTFICHAYHSSQVLTSISPTLNQLICLCIHPLFTYMLPLILTR